MYWSPEVSKTSQKGYSTIIRNWVETGATVWTCVENRQTNTPFLYTDIQYQVEAVSYMMYRLQLLKNWALQHWNC